MQQYLRKQNQPRVVLVPPGEVVSPSELVPLGESGLHGYGELATLDDDGLGTLDEEEELEDVLAMPM